MRFKIIIAAAIALAFATASAAPPQGGPVAIGAAMLQAADQPGGADTPKVALIQPAAPAPIIDTGTLAGQALTWVITTFGTLIGGVLTAWLYKMFQKAGIDLTAAQRDQLDSIIVNGLHAGASTAQEQLRGKGQIEVKDIALQNAVRYVQLHGADTLKALGSDPMSQTAVEVIKARIEKAIADPNAPTPAMFDPPAPAAAPPRPAAPAPAPAATVNRQATAGG